MVRFHMRVLAGSCLLLYSAGCAHVTGSALPGPVAGMRSASPDDLPVCPRQEVTVDLAGSLPPVSAPEGEGGSGELPPYHCLGDQECLCRAVSASTMANLKDLEQQAIRVREEKDPKNCKGGESAEAELQHKILYYLSLEDRNRSGAEALDKYYQLGAAEGYLDIVRQSLKSAESTLAKASSLKAQGLDAVVDVAKLYAQQLDLRAQSARVRMSIEHLNSELRVALDFCPPEADWRFWPTDAFNVGDEPVSLATAIAVGVANRPELILLGILEKELSSDNAGAAQQMLKAISGALAMSKSPSPCPMLDALLAKLCGCCDDDTRELQIRQAQLHEYHAYREREVVEQIGQAVRAISAQMELIELARREAKRWEEKFNEAEDKVKNGVGSFAETADAKGDWLKARRKIIEETANLQRARVLLHQAQGILPCECIPPADSH